MISLPFLQCRLILTHDSSLSYRLSFVPLLSPSLLSPLSGSSLPLLPAFLPFLPQGGPVQGPSLSQTHRSQWGAGQSSRSPLQGQEKASLSQWDQSNWDVSFQSEGGASLQGYTRTLLDYFTGITKNNSFLAGTTCVRHYVSFTWIPQCPHSTQALQNPVRGHLIRSSSPATPPLALSAPTTLTASPVLRHQAQSFRLPARGTLWPRTLVPQMSAWPTLLGLPFSM